MEPGTAHLLKRLKLVERHLDESMFLLGEQYTIADMYLFTVCT